ncbi:MAG: HNH endonuclease, partial [Candidatus Rokubacteria bacterium]|nr:HNH endonuclease [Candidatus Rokubacteria bacterium]
MADPVTPSEYYAPVEPEVLRRERERARELRQSQWWKRRLAAGVCHYCGRQVGPRALTMD